MPSHLTVSEDRFAQGIKELLGDIAPKVRDGVTKSVKTAMKTSKAETRMNWSSQRSGNGKGTYGGGFQYRVKGQGTDNVSGEMGNPRYPGLPHLLEKGHRTIGGVYGGDGFVDGREHMGPAFDVAAAEFEANVSKAVDAAL